ncbi:MAG: hypothetical protein ACRDT0_22860 [Pseudonocardiaceae bacterium]
MTDSYSATPWLAYLRPEWGWSVFPISDVALIYVRERGRWVDTVAIFGEDDTVAFRHHDDDQELTPLAFDRPGYVWMRHGRCEDVLRELMELPAR